MINNNNKMAEAVNVIRKEQELDIFRIEVNSEKGYYIWISTRAEEGEERCTEVDFYQDLYDFAYNRMHHSGHIKVNIYNLDIDYLQVPHDELNGIISNVIMSGCTKFVETRYIKVEETKTTDGGDCKITVFDVNSTTKGKWKTQHWKTLGFITGASANAEHEEVPRGQSRMQTTATKAKKKLNQKRCCAAEETTGNHEYRTYTECDAPELKKIV
jgi:hypothetical protein